MRRAGSTLQYQLTARLVEQSGAGRRVEWVRPNEFASVLRRHNRTTGIKVFKCHFLLPEIADLFRQGQARGVYCYRDVRDCCTSWMIKTKSDFARMWARDILGEMLEQFRLWTATPGVSVSRYEEMIDDRVAEVRRIADHLGIAVDHEAASAIAADFSIARQRTRMRVIESSTDEATVITHGDQKLDRTELLHSDHIATGTRGAFLEHLTPLEVRLIERRAGGWLQAQGYALTGSRLSLPERLQMWRRYRVLEGLRAHAQAAHPRQRGTA